MNSQKYYWNPSLRELFVCMAFRPTLYERLSKCKIMNGLYC